MGSWLVERLMDEGHEVFCLVRPSSDLSDLERFRCRFTHGDVTDLDSLMTSFSSMDAVFHLAGMVSYQRADRQRMELINVEGTKNVIEAVRKKKVGRLIYMSSVVAVGAGFSPSEILNEESPYNIHHLNLSYFETKRKAEILVTEATKNAEVDAVILNPSTVYGARDAKKGSRRTQVKVAQGRFPFYTSGGVSVVNVEAIVEAIITAWKKAPSGERYILSGDNITIKQLFQIIAQCAGVQPPRIKVPNWLLHSLGFTRDQMMQLGLVGSASSINRENALTATLFHWFDSSKAKTHIGFAPKKAQYAIEKSVQWMREAGLLKSLDSNTET